MTETAAANLAELLAEPRLVIEPGVAARVLTVRDPQRCPWGELEGFLADEAP